MSTLVARVSPDITSVALQSEYTYRIPSELQVNEGDFVIVPFGNRTIVGCVVKIESIKEQDLKYQLKDIHATIENLSLPSGLLNVLRYASDTYLAPLGSAVACAMPPGLRMRVINVYRRKNDFDLQKFSEKENQILSLMPANEWVSERKLVAVKNASKDAIRALIKKGVLEKSAKLTEERFRQTEFYQIGDPASVDIFLAEEGSKKPAQAACLLQLQNSPYARLTYGELKALTSASEQTITHLVQSGLLVKTLAEKEYPKLPKHKLNKQQDKAFKDIVQSVNKRQFDRFLLFGITGSGKTEVYMNVIEECLKIGRRALYLLPEIALTAHIIEILRGRFGDSVAVLHSALSDKERLSNWRRIRGGDAVVVVGARSAIFAPLEDIGVIIVDEEHETSYKQENNPRYHLRELAEFRAKEEGAVLVLGSATPSVETFYRSQIGEIKFLEITKRATDWKLPDVEIIDLREAYKTGAPGIISEQLKQEMEETFERGEQVILFLNRRAYAISLLCRDCGYQPKCKNCSINMNFHRATKQLRCHHCDLKISAPDTCPQCGGNRIRALGLGTERVEEAVKKEFPSIKISRLDRDVARKKGAIESVFANLASGDTQVLVGTQMIAKGLDFPNVTLVGVIAADTGLSIPDFRSTERTFQLLTQVAGRAGRHKPGKVIIQTFQPEHPAIVFSASHDYKGFYESEIIDRESANYPPFVRLVNVVAISRKQQTAISLINKTSQEYSKLKQCEVVGPAPCPLEKLRGEFRYHLLLKCEKGMDIAQLRLAESVTSETGGTLIVDIDPVSLM